MTPDQLKHRRRTIADAARRYYAAIRSSRSAAHVARADRDPFDEIDDAHDAMPPSVRLSDALGVWS